MGKKLPHGVATKFFRHILKRRCTVSNGEQNLLELDLCDAPRTVEGMREEVRRIDEQMLPACEDTPTRHRLEARRDELSDLVLEIESDQECANLDCCLI